MQVIRLILCLSLLGICFLAFSDTQKTHPPAKDATPPWNKHLKAFEMLIATEPDVAHTELAKVSENLFGKHRHVPEWESLYLNLSQNQKGSISELKRAAELVILMLIDIDAEKHQEQIQRHQKRLKYYDTLAKQHKTQGVSPDTVVAPLQRFQLRDVWMDDIEELDRYIAEVNAHLSTDKKATRASFDKYAKVMFGSHPHLDEWSDIVFQLCIDGKGKLPQFIRMVELQLEMFKEVDDEKYAHHIKAFELGLQQLETTAEMSRHEVDTLEISFILQSRPKVKDSHNASP